MIEIGKTQCLNIVKVTDFGVYLGTEEDKVLLPKKQVPSTGRTQEIKGFAGDRNRSFP